MPPDCRIYASLSTQVEKRTRPKEKRCFWQLSETKIEIEWRNKSQNEKWQKSKNMKAREKNETRNKTKFEVIGKKWCFVSHHFFIITLTFRPTSYANGDAKCFFQIYRFKKKKLFCFRTAAVGKKEKNARLGSVGYLQNYTRGIYPGNTPQRTSVTSVRPLYPYPEFL